MILHLRFSGYFKGLVTWIFLGQAIIHSEEWRSMPEPLKNIDRLASNGSSVWLLGKTSPHYRLFNYQNEGIATYDSTQNSLISGGWYPHKLFLRSDTLFIDQYAGDHWGYYNQVIRFDSGFSEIPVRQQLISMNDSTYYTWDGMKISRFVRGDLVPYLDLGLNKEDGFGAYKHLSFFLEDGRGGYWAGLIQYSDIRECRGVFKITPESTVQYPFDNQRLCVMDAAVDPRGSVYFATSEGLMVYTNGNLKTIVPEDPRVNREYNTVHIDRKGRVWAGNGVWDSSFQVMRIDNGKLNILKEFNLNRQEKGGINDILEDEMGNVWIAGTNIPVYLYNDTAIAVTMSINSNKFKMSKRRNSNKPIPFILLGTSHGYDLSGRRLLYKKMKNAR